MGFLRSLGYFLGASYGLFVVLVLILIVTVISLAIKYVLEQKTSLNKEAITAITVICGLVAFFVLAAPMFLGVSFGFLNGFVNSLFPDF